MRLEGGVQKPEEGTGASHLDRRSCNGGESPWASNHVGSRGISGINGVGWHATHALQDATCTWLKSPTLRSAARIAGNARGRPRWRTWVIPISGLREFRVRLRCHAPQEPLESLGAVLIPHIGSASCKIWRGSPKPGRGGAGGTLVPRSGFGKRIGVGIGRHTAHERAGGVPLGWNRTPCARLRGSLAMLEGDRAEEAGLAQSVQGIKPEGWLALEVDGTRLLSGLEDFPPLGAHRAGALLRGTLRLEDVGLAAAELVGLGQKAGE